MAILRTYALLLSQLLVMFFFVFFLFFFVLFFSQKLFLFKFHLRLAQVGGWVGDTDVPITV